MLTNKDLDKLRIHPARPKPVDHHAIKEAHTVERKYAYRLANGDFYRQATNGDWGAKKRKQVTVKGVLHATLFSKTVGSTPYDATFMIGGKWVLVTKRIQATWEDI